MSVSDSNIERIESYLSGLMSQDEVLGFEQELASNTELSKELEVRSLANQLIIHQRLFDVKSKLQEIGGNAPQVKKGGAQWFYAGLLTLITVGGVITLTLNQGKTAEESRSIVQKQKVLNSQSSQATATVSDPEGEKRIDHEVTNSSSYEVISESGQNPSIEEVEIDKSYFSDSVDAEDPIVEATTQEVQSFQADPCADVIIRVPLTAKSACFDQFDGSVWMDTDKISGGKPDYEFSLDKERFYPFNNFKQLGEGEYVLHIRDENGCTGIEHFEVEGRDCERYNLHLDATSGSIIEFSGTQDKAGVVTVYSRSRVVHVIDFDEYDLPTWDGRDRTGNWLPVGAYPYLIQFSDESEPIQGEITIHK